MQSAHFYWPLFLHSILEFFPISSSWHLKSLFHLSSQITHQFHILLIPGLLLILLFRTKKSDLPAQKVIMIFSMIPVFLIYFLIKSRVISKITLPMELIHFSMGLLLLTISNYQLKLSRQPELSPIPTSLLWILMGCLEPLGALIPGLSRMTASFIPGLYWKLDFRKTLVISFILNLSLLLIKLMIDYHQQHLFIPNQLEIILAIFGTMIGWGLAESFEWNFLKMIGYYRITLGILLFILPYLQ